MKSDITNRRVDKVWTLVRNTPEGSTRIAEITYYNNKNLIRIVTWDDFTIYTLSKIKTYDGYKRFGKIGNMCGILKTFWYHKVKSN